MENASKASIHLRNLWDLREKFWNLWLYREYVKALPQSYERNARSSQKRDYLLVEMIDGWQQKKP